MANVEVKDSGSLQDKSAISRLLDLAQNPFKGVLIFGRGKEKKSFIFDEGKPHFPTALLTEAALGKKLFEKNLIDADQFKKIKELEATGKTFFQALMDLPTVKERVLNYVLEVWIEDLSTVFSWESGQFASVEFLPKDVTKVEIDQPLYHYFFKALVMKNKKVKSKLSPTVRFEIDVSTELGFKPEDIRMNGLEKNVFERFKQMKAVKTVSSEVGSTDAQVGPIILSLREIGFAKADSDRKKPQVAIVEPMVLSDEFTKADEKRLFDKLQNMDELDYFQMLDVDRGVSQQNLQLVYFSLAKKYHPDRIKAKVSIPTKDAERFFAKITEAYNTLSNVQLRKDYEFKTSKEATQHQEMMKNIVESEKVYLEGKILINKGQFAEAVEKINQAIALYDQEPEYFVSMAWAMFRQAVKDNKNLKIVEAKKILVDAYNREYQMVDVSFYLGMISKHEGKFDQAANYFRKCVSLDKNHALAMSELRIIEKKLDEKPGKKK